MNIYVEKAIGCMLGGAYGDSLGAAVEFIDIDTIRSIFGNSGIERCHSAFGHGPGVITDDTQMAIATAEGLISLGNASQHENSDISKAIWKSYLKWLDSQSFQSERRGPGSTCLSALQTGIMGTLDHPLNNSSGCGGIMRSHPVGIYFFREATRAFQVGMLSAVITHGNPNGYVPAGALAMLIALLIQGYTLENAIPEVLKEVQKLPYQIAEGTIAAINIALKTPKKCSDFGKLIDEKIIVPGSRGGGWQGHDALAISLYAALASPNDPIRAIQIAVNHSGDSDSTGSITGSIVGSIYGPEIIYQQINGEGLRLERCHEAIVLAKKLVAIREEEI